MKRQALVLILVGLAALALAPGGRAARAAELIAASADAAPPVASAVASPAALPGSRDLQLEEYFVHVPPGGPDRWKVLVVLHGMGGEGHSFCAGLLARTDREHWVVVA